MNDPRAPFTSSLFNFTDFAMRLLEGQRFASSGHGQLICEVLQDIQRKKLKNLIINIPPGHSKTFCVTAGLIPFILGHDPQCRAYYVSSTVTEASKKTAKTNTLLRSEAYKWIFPNIELSKTGDKYMTVKNALGSIATYGARAGITGGDSDLLVLDDPVDASASKHVMKEAQVKIQQSFFTRLRAKENGDNYGYILINQRTGENDMTRFFLDNYDVGYHLKLPFLESEPKTYIYNNVTFIRGANIPLNPTFYSTKRAKLVCGDFEKSDTAKRLFETQFQQNPRPVEGQLMKLEHFHYYNSKSLKQTKFKELFFTIDAASKSKEYNDYSVICCWGIAGTKLCLLDMRRGKWEFLQLSKIFESFYQKWKSGFNNGGSGVKKILVEDASAGTQLIQSYQNLFPKHLIKPVKRTADKFTRYTAVGRFIETNQVLLPTKDLEINGVISTHLEITKPFLEECLEFTHNDAHRHDDIVDNLIDATAYAFLKEESWIDAITRNNY